MNEINVALDKEPFVVVSDIHSDPEALEQILTRVSHTRYECFLGDVAGYGYEFKRAVKRLENFNVGIAGNHDEALLSGNYSSFSGRAREILEQQAKVVSRGERQFLSSLKPSFKRGNILMFHGTPESSDEYIMNEIDIATFFAKHPSYDLSFGGHMHFPRVAIQNKKTGRVSFADIQQDSTFSRHNLNLAENRYLINVPAVSRPRANSRAGACAVFHESDTEKSLNFYFMDK